MAKRDWRRWTVGVSVALLLGLTLLLQRSPLRDPTEIGTAPRLSEDDGAQTEAGPAAASSAEIQRSTPDARAVSAQAAGSEPETASVRTVLPSPNARRASTMEPSAWVEGRVTTPQHAPIASARLTLSLWERPPRVLAVAVSDRAGRFELKAPAAGRYRLAVEKRGFASLDGDVELPPAGVLRRDYVMEPAAAAIRGRVTDQNGAPLSDVWVTSMFVENYSPTKTQRFLPRDARTDQEGRFEIKGLPAADIALRFAARGFLTDGVNLTLRQGEEAFVPFRLEKGRSLRRLVTDVEGAPIPSARLDCGGSELFPADPQGVVLIVLRREDTGEIGCQLLAEGYLAMDVVVDPEVERGQFTLQAGPEFRGAVLNEQGHPIAGAEVIVSGQGRHYEGAVASDNAGRFTLRLSRPPASIVTATSPGFVQQRLVFGEGEAPNDLEIRLRRGEAGLFGLVVDSAGAPVRLFTVRLRDGDARYSRHFNDPEGRFEVNDIPSGTYRIEVSSPQDELQGLAVSAGPVEIPPGKTVGELLLRFPSP